MDYLEDFLKMFPMSGHSDLFIVILWLSLSINAALILFMFLKKEEIRVFFFTPETLKNFLALSDITLPDRDRIFRVIKVLMSVNWELIEDGLMVLFLNRIDAFKEKRKKMFKKET